ncbi:MAG TPA: ABC transporter substrate-binding protein [Stellaceae bacterium]|jgi:NitT/TauT family transport system substrate-binding protein|nr:ABC transporter substrate-binding protein [Stellaceae bacterium]
MRFPTKTMAVAVLALSAGTAQAAEKTVMEHATLSLPAINLGFLSRFVADDEGFWKKEGIDVTVQVIQGVGSTNAVIAGSIDFAFASAATITRAKARGQNLVALATQSRESGETIVIRKSIADAAHFDPKAPLKERGKILQGHSFAVGGAGAIPDVVLKVVAQEAGVPANSVTVAPMSPDAQVAAFDRGAVDGFVSGPPFTQIATVAGTAVIVSDATKGEPTDYSPVSSGLILARADFCPAHKSICTKFMRGVVDALTFIKAHKTETLAIMKKHFSAFDDKVLAAAYDDEVAIQPAKPITTPQELENGDRLNVAAGFLKKEDMLPEYASIIDNEFVQ